MADYTMCSANEDVCLLAKDCKRSSWRDNPQDTQYQSFADFSEELVKTGKEPGTVSVSCPFFRTDG